MKVHAKFMLPDERCAAGTARSRRTAFTGIMDCLKFRYATAEPLRRSEQDYHGVLMARLAWAAATIGTTPNGPPRRRRAYALELQRRGAMMRASILPDRRSYWRSNGCERLDLISSGSAGSCTFTTILNIGGSRSRARPGPEHGQDLGGGHGGTLGVAAPVPATCAVV